MPTPLIPAVDGKTLTLLSKRAFPSHAKVCAVGTIDQLVDQLRAKYHRPSLPAADLLMSNPYDQLMPGVIDVRGARSRQRRDPRRRMRSLLAFRPTKSIGRSDRSGRSSLSVPLRHHQLEGGRIACVKDRSDRLENGRRGCRVDSFPTCPQCRSKSQAAEPRATGLEFDELSGIFKVHVENSHGQTDRRSWAGRADRRRPSRRRRTFPDRADRRVYPSAAQARVGRPLTPMSVAGVARRTARPFHHSRRDGRVPSSDVCDDPAARRTMLLSTGLSSALTPASLKSARQPNTLKRLGLRPRARSAGESPR